MRPYGSADFVQVGAQAQFRVDARDRVRQPSRGTLLALGGSWYPAAYDVAAPFGEAHGEAAAYLTARIPLQPTLALRVAAKKVWGSYPFHEAAYVGGAATVRGFSEHRFAGDGAVYGNAELRLPLARIFVLLPEELGVFGLADAGRVYLDAPDRTLRRRGVTCRFRTRIDDRRLLTLRVEPGPGDVGPPQLYEAEVAELDEASALAGSSDPARRLRALIDPQLLTSRIEFETERRRRRSRPRWFGNAVYELCYDI